MSDTILPEAGNSDIGRNEPCPCGSRKKYKRCHGVSAAPKLGAPKAMPAMPTMPGGMDNPLAGMDPAMMAQLAQAVQRLPRGQMQKLQSIMQRAMSGKDVTREAQEFEKTLPPNFKDLMSGFQLPPEMMAQMGGASESSLPAFGEVPVDAATMSAEDARAIVAKAAAEGKISEEQAQALLEGSKKEAEAGASKKFWKR